MFVFWSFIQKKDSSDDYADFVKTQLDTYRPTDLFHQKKESFSPEYEKELALFKTMTLSEQQMYLNLSKDQKYATYGNKL